jgi:hypothetical protein
MDQGNGGRRSGAGRRDGRQAQESTNRVAVETAWSVFVDGDPRECWVVSAPTE